MDWPAEAAQQLQQALTTAPTVSRGRLMASHNTITIDAQVDRKPVDGWPGYEIGADALVWSLCGRSPRLLKTFRKPTGHVCVQLRRPGRRWTVGVHHLLLSHFGSARPSSLHECRHLDGNPTNNRLDNLTWGTKLQNAQDRKKHGRNPVGVRHGQAKMNDDKVLELLELRASGWSQGRLASFFGISRRGVRLILSGINWAHVSHEPQRKEQ